MRLSTLMIAACLALAGALPASALTVETRMSADFQKKIDKDYGQREVEVLSESLTKKVERAFADRNVKAERVVVTIEDAKPNRPTFQQVSDKPGLDAFRSISTGGAKVTGVAYDASGKEIGTFTYRWYENDIDNAIGSTTWTDARSTFDRFATRFAAKLS